MAAPATLNVNTVKYNDIPADSDLLKKVKRLKKGEQVRYRVYGSYDPSQPTKFFGRTLRVPPTDIIGDPKTGNTYDIAMIKSTGAGGVPELDDEIFFEPIQRCEIVLNANNAREMRQYQYFELCNYNADNPDRDTSKPKLFERVDEERDLNSKRTKFKKIVAAMATLESFTEEDVLNFIRSNRLPDMGSYQRNLAALEEFAQKDPDKFATSPLLDHTSLYKIIEDATKAKIIVFNKTTKEYSTFDERKLFAVSKQFGVSNKDEFAKHLMSPEGQKDLEWIKIQLEK